MPFVQEFYGEDADLQKEISGSLYRHANGFGLVNYCYIPAHLMAKIPDNEQEVRVKAMLSYDKKKNKLSWKAIDIISKGETSELCVGLCSSQNSLQFSPSRTT
ncbi:MAG: hypothetical protein GW809_08835 [Bacteroidetes bacterium]|nr:hypothetical protein [Bacteroidota bacterium]NCQ12226.1 hypothetical protein [Bacteroidota bacterium]